MTPPIGERLAAVEQRLTSLESAIGDIKELLTKHGERREEALRAVNALATTAEITATEVRQLTESISEQGKAEVTCRDGITQRLDSMDRRMSALERAQAEARGALKTVAAIGAFVGAAVSAAVTFWASHRS